jgi:hypothetical protein
MSNIFAKQDTNAQSNNTTIIESISDTNVNDSEDGNFVLYIEDIKKQIPANSTSKPNTDLQKSHTEWRWRFFNVNGRKLIEITRKYPNKDRDYIDNTGKWIKYVLDDCWDKYVVQTNYCYIVQ